MTKADCQRAPTIRHGAAMSAIALTLGVPAFAGTTQLKRIAPLMT
jgi:hypothetical protein